MRRRLVKKRHILMATVLILMVMVCYSGYRVISELNPISKGRPSAEIVSKTVVKDGVSYYPRQDITVFMLIGIDQKGPKVDSGSYNNSGQADLISLLVFDKAEREYRILLLNRDTMVDVPILGVGGKSAGTINAQLALAHNQGSGLHDSCENMKKALTKFLGNIPIDYYVSMNLDAISILNDAVGGVKVNVKDDFSLIDSSIPMGEVLLNGDQALSFVQTRKDVGDQLNITRMERHTEYMNEFFNAFKTKTNGSKSFLLNTYEKVEEFIVSDCPVNTLNTLIDRYSSYDLEEVVSPTGTNTHGEKYMEFYADEEELLDLTLRLFYSEKGN